MAEKKKKRATIVSPRGVAAYAWINRPDTGQKFSDNKYKVTLVVDADDSGIEELRKKLIAVAKEEWGEVPEDLKLPIYDGDEKNKDEFKGKTLIIAKSQYQPTVVDAKRNELPENVFVMSGDVVKFSATPFPYENTEKVKEGKKTVTVKVQGVTLQLRAIQLLEKRSFGDAGNDFEEDEDGFDASTFSTKRGKAKDEDGGEEETGDDGAAF